MVHCVANCSETVILDSEVIRNLSSRHSYASNDTIKLKIDQVLMAHPALKVWRTDGVFERFLIEIFFLGKLAFIRKLKKNRLISSKGIIMDWQETLNVDIWSKWTKIKILRWQKDAEGCNSGTIWLVVYKKISGISHRNATYVVLL